MKKTLYCSRNLLNGDDLVSWAQEQGFPKCLSPDQMHATIAYSKRKFYWSAIKPRANRLIIRGGHRSIEVFDKAAVVLQFQSNSLKNRWEMFLNAGASWDYDEYKSHITITYNGLPSGLSQKDIIPYSGELIFGPEKLEPLNSNWKSTTVEIDTNKIFDKK